MTMDKSGTGLLVFAVLIAIVAGSGRLPLAPDQTKARTSTTSNIAAKGVESTTIPRNGLADQASAATNDIKKATTAGLSSVDRSYLETSIRSILKADAAYAPDNCWPKDAKNGTKKPAKCWPRDDIGFFIAILPDPKRTHLALSFDRYLDALGQAIQDRGYDLDRAILPWDPTEHQEPSDYAKRVEEEQYTRDKERVREF
jgi:hypothetical protein